MWPRFVNAALGIWLMAAPDLLAYGEPARTNDQIVGPIIASLAVVAIWETTRALRWVNLVLGLWLLAAPFVLGYPGERTTINSLLVGAIVGGLSLVRGKLYHRVGGGWTSLWRA